MIYCLYIFDRHCQCVFYTEWNRSPDRSRTESSLSFSEPSTPYVWPKPFTTSTADPRDGRMDDEAKLVYGVVFSLKNMVTKLSHSKDSDGFVSYRTNSYKLHYYGTASGVRFVLLTDPTVPSLRDVLRQIYLHIYLEYVIKNPLFPYDPQQSRPISNDYFRNMLNSYIKGLSCYQS
ncbi:Trafficking protein particle complex subunit BET5 [Dispira simplex]|nr:Trafficking protein particle complex subunit BET5 [Dispira simplex]